MPANWNLPTITSGYLDFVTEMNDKFVDAGTIGYGAPTNLPEHAMRFNRSINIFEEWLAGAWVAKTIGVTGGGTGASDAAAARVNLGIGSMGTQNSNAVNITGGSITGVALNADAIAAGIVALARGGTGASLSLGAPGTVMLSNGTAVVFAPGTSIQQLNASNLSTGIVPLARLSGVGLLDFANQWNAYNNFVIGIGVTPAINVTADSPYINLINTTGALNEKRLSFLNYLGQFIIQSQNDDASFKANLLIVSPSGVLSANGSGLVNLNGSAINAGLVAAPFLGTGTPDTTKFLRGDNTWQPVTGGIPSGLIAMFATGCPTGWTRVAALDNKFPLGSTGFGGSGGSDVHSHGVSGNTGNAGTHQHAFGVHVNSGPITGAILVAPGSAVSVAANPHQHAVDHDGDTANAGNHAHTIDLGTTNANHMPPYLTVVYCQKD